MGWAKKTWDDSLYQNPRVRGGSSDSAVVLSNDACFANTGSRGESPLRGVGWNPTPTKKQKSEGRSSTVPPREEGALEEMGSVKREPAQGVEVGVGEG